MNNSHIQKCHAGKKKWTYTFNRVCWDQLWGNKYRKNKIPHGICLVFCVVISNKKYVSNFFWFHSHTQLSLILLRFKFHNCYANVFAFKAKETLCRNDKIMSTKRGGSPKKLDKRLVGCNNSKNSKVNCKSHANIENMQQQLFTSTAAKAQCQCQSESTFLRQKFWICRKKLLSNLIILAWFLRRWNLV